MKIRLVVSISAAPGKGVELAQAFRQRCADVVKEPGCEQFEVFQSVPNPDKLALLGIVVRPGRARCPRQGQPHPRADAARAAGRRQFARGLPIQPDPLTRRKPLS